MYTAKLVCERGEGGGHEVREGWKVVLCREGLKLVSEGGRVHGGQRPP